MSGFKALNIEYDEESDIEVDDTKEIQIEDALKLYQTALRYHAEGPSSFGAASKAYLELFKSEIFSYPESVNELNRLELLEPDGHDEALEYGEGLQTTFTNSFDGAPSTLPQILHLSHKNYAQFKLQNLAARVNESQASFEDVVKDAGEAIDHFVSALDKDETDLDLWKQTSQVGDLLNSRRIARFCLEAVLDGDDEGLTSVLSLPGLDDAIAGQRLREMVMNLDDHLSALQISLPTAWRRPLSSHMKNRLDMLSQAIVKARSLPQPALSPQRPTHKVLERPSTWAELSLSILNQAEAEGENRARYVGPVLYSFKDASDKASGSTEDEIAAPDEAHPLIPSTVRPSPAATDSHMHDGKTTIILETNDQDEQNEPSKAQLKSTEDQSKTTALPTRKRSGDTAGINDNAEEGRSRSKRIRARGSMHDSTDSKQVLNDVNVQWEYDQHLNEIQGADDWLYETIGGIFERVGASCIETIKDVKGALIHDQASPVTKSDSRVSAAQVDFFAFLNDYTDIVAQNLLRRGDDWQLYPTESAIDNALPGHDRATGTRKVFAAMPERGLRHLLRLISSREPPLAELGALFIKPLFFPGKFGSPNDPRYSAYEAYLWPDDLKTNIVRALITFDATILEHTQTAWMTVHNRLQDVDEDYDPYARLLTLRRLIQNIFELHLDIFCLIRPSNSGVNAAIVTEQDDRLQRWFELTRKANFWAKSQDSQSLDELDLRFLWATTCLMAVQQDASQRRTLHYMQDLRQYFENGDTVIYLPNNAVMPELSLSALDREIAKLTTKDFFDKVSDMQIDNVLLIETIEPLLEVLHNRTGAHARAGEADRGASAVPEELIQYLENGNINAVLKLWRRLCDAYQAIGYTPMAVRTLYRTLRLVLHQLNDEQYPQNPLSEKKHIALLTNLRALKNIIAEMFELAQRDDALECMDEEDLREAIETLSNALRLLQTLNVFEDPIRIGKNQAPLLATGNAAPTFQKFCQVLHDMQLRMWIMLYHILKEIIAQNAELFPNALEDRFDFLRTLHRNLGIRAICGGINRAFVRLLNDDFFQMTQLDSYDSEQAQVLYDLYGINCFLNPSYELMEHHCTSDAFLNSTVAMQTVDLLLAQARKLPMKELIKHQIKDAIDKVHGAIARKKPTEAILKNREVVRSYLRSPINPVNMYQCLTGEGNQLLVLPVPESDAVLASKGWFFLMGHIALTKFRSVKRTGLAPTEDVDIAIAFFMQELEFTTANWETWFRLAQAYDTKIEESVVWSAEKLNNSMEDMVQLQKAAIHCYIMAAALAHRSADLAPETTGKMTELYAEFAMRLYSSSREPFSMKPFAQDLSEKPLSSRNGMVNVKVFEPLRTFTCWKLAKALFQRAIFLSPSQWTLHYMLGKCLWKMYNSPEAFVGQFDPPTPQTVLDVLYHTIELLPGKKEAGGSKREPILEPHYKLISIVNKLVEKDRISLSEAQTALQHTHYSNGVDFPQHRDGWKSYVLSLVKCLRTADKSNWHHRLVARAATIIYNDYSRGDRATRAAAAKHELTQQMFTKTMVLQVWRPEAERPGRHFVYTARYTTLFVRLLEILKDRPSLDMLAKRNRRRQHDTFDNMTIWSTIILAWLHLIREHARIPEGLEASTFSTITQEDFNATRKLLEQWMQSQETGADVALDALREAQELKKVNQNLLKPGEIDDLLGDAYAVLFNSKGKPMLAEQQSKLQLDKESASALAADRAPSPALPPAPPIQSNPMSLAHMMNMDGANSSDLEPEAKGEAVTPEPEAAAPSKKKIGIGRREIRTAAEACMQKTGLSTVNNATKVPTSTPEVPRIADLIKSERGVAAVSTGDDSAQPSAPASVHDDADDESSLSEFEEAVEEMEVVELAGDHSVLSGENAAVEVKEHVPPTTLTEQDETGTERFEEAMTGENGPSAINPVKQTNVAMTEALPNDTPAHS